VPIGGIEGARGPRAPVDVAKEVRKLAKGKVNRSAISGRFSKATAKRHPRTTVTETVKRPSGKRK
jgi:hypothetical protein